ncbi:hypothetical protein IscW_ISCW012760 [Ixodes scapularis]|uniref:Uncharacterized protein n=1 Tax=Ixodes scapularis TaxID=6945 RepID=B7QB54_IXOSC|nr:hypothetical protein IscW_ISCW012760 [Ixodes scapularis]|eukprot:XP_002412780.1 hypothetical protein IscW_ISCW012760 [Ixodes scapularis]
MRSSLPNGGRRGGPGEPFRATRPAVGRPDNSDDGHAAGAAVPHDCKQRLRHESATASAAAAAQALRRFPATDKSPHRYGLRLQADSVFEPCGPRSCLTSLRPRRFFG